MLLDDELHGPGALLAGRCRVGRALGAAGPAIEGETSKRRWPGSPSPGGRRWPELVGAVSLGRSGPAVACETRDARPGRRRRQAVAAARSAGFVAETVAALEAEVAEAKRAVAEQRPL